MSYHDDDGPRSEAPVAVSSAQQSDDRFELDVRVMRARIARRSGEKRRRASEWAKAGCTTVR